ncbi:DUF6478 family protein [Paracoccus pacificus]|uniref:DUF6478 family protein n=1 Tax=Paracoccus pacificus TaxID=1463598 RepID=A0ABW4R363_9RHOB
MTGNREGWIDRVTRRRGDARWTALAADPGDLGSSRLRRLRSEAVSLRQVLDRFLANTTVAALRPAPVNADHLPGATDWHWRSDLFQQPMHPSSLVSPASGTRLAEGATIWHDDPQAALILRQSRSRADDLPPFGLSIEALGCEGQFVSLSIDLPAAVLTGLGPDFVVRADMRIWAERPLTAYARLNIENGPNTDSMQQGFQPAAQGAADLAVAEFDLAYSELNEKRLSKMWVDVIFERPRMNAVELRDIVISRHPRADV